MILLHLIISFLIVMSTCKEGPQKFCKEKSLIKYKSHGRRDPFVPPYLFKHQKTKVKRLSTDVVKMKKELMEELKKIKHLSKNKNIKEAYRLCETRLKNIQPEKYKNISELKEILEEYENMRKVLYEKYRRIIAHEKFNNAKLFLSGIVVDEHERIVIINNKLLHEGDVIKGIKISEINKEKVVFEVDGVHIEKRILPEDRL